MRLVALYRIESGVFYLRQTLQDSSLREKLVRGLCDIVANDEEPQNRSVAASVLGKCASMLADEESWVAALAYKVLAAHLDEVWSAAWHPKQADARASALEAIGYLLETVPALHDAERLDGLFLNMLTETKFDAFIKSQVCNELADSRQMLFCHIRCCRICTCT